MTDTLISDGEPGLLDEGIGSVTDGNERWYSAAIIGAVCRVVTGAYVVQGTGFADIVTTDGSESVNVDAGMATVQVSSVQFQTTLGGDSTPAYDETVPVPITVPLILPTQTGDLALAQDTVNDLWLALETDGTGPGGTPGDIYIRHGSGLSAPSHPSVKLGTVDSTDGSTTRPNDVADLSGEASMAHSDLTGVGSSDHHSKYTDAEAVAAVEATDPLSMGTSAVEFARSNNYVAHRSGDDRDMVISGDRNVENHIDPGGAFTAEWQIRAEGSKVFSVNESGEIVANGGIPEPGPIGGFNLTGNILAGGNIIRFDKANNYVAHRSNDSRDQVISGHRNVENHIDPGNNFGSAEWLIRAHGSKVFAITQTGDIIQAGTYNGVPVDGTGAAVGQVLTATGTDSAQWEAPPGFVQLTDESTSSSGSASASWATGYDTLLFVVEYTNTSGSGTILRWDGLNGGSISADVRYNDGTSTSGVSSIWTDTGSGNETYEVGIKMQGLGGTLDGLHFEAEPEYYHGSGMRSGIMNTPSADITGCGFSTFETGDWRIRVYGRNH